MIRVSCGHCGKIVRRQVRRKLVTCTPCRKKNNAATSAAWYARHKGDRDTGKWWREHPAQRLAYMRKWRKENRTGIRLYSRLYAREATKRNRKLLDELPCEDCGMRHTLERRAVVLRRLLPASPEEIREAAPCIWGLPFEHSTAGEAMLYRDLASLGARSVAGSYTLREAA